MLNVQKLIIILANKRVYCEKNNKRKQALMIVNVEKQNKNGGKFIKRHAVTFTVGN